MDEFIEIPFGANDSELKGWEYTIPDDMEAEIKDGKIIVRQKENKDEKIRKNILALVKKHAVNHERVQMEDWLEKKKEQKSVERATMQDFNYREGEPDEKAWSRLFAILNYAGATSGDTPGEEIQALINWIEGKQKEQKLSIFPLGLGEVHFNPISCEQKPADWTGYNGIVIDKTKYPELTDAEFAILRGFTRVTGFSHFPISIIKETAQDFLAHLPAEWSEEEVAIIDGIIQDVRNMKMRAQEDVDHPASKEELDAYDEELDFLNRLKSLYPQSQWKPSKEQIEALECAERWYSDNMGSNSHLWQLLCDLKKL